MVDIAQQLRLRLVASASCVEDMDGMDMEVEMKTADLQEGSPSEHLDEVLPGIALPRHWILQFRQSCQLVLGQ
jgi:hypothetical protein